MLKEFKEFALRGNVIDLAVAVVLGAAITAIVNAIVEGIVSPIIGMILGGVDFSSLAVTVGEASLKYGMVIQQIINFIIIAFCLFLMVRSINRVNERAKKRLGKDGEPVEEEPAPPTQEELLTEIRDLLKEQK